MEMIESHNFTVDSYDEDILEEEFKKIINLYRTAFIGLQTKNGESDMKFGLTDNTIEKINSVFRQHPEIEEAISFH